MSNKLMLNDLKIGSFYYIANPFLEKIVHIEFLGMKEGKHIDIREVGTTKKEAHLCDNINDLGLTKDDNTYNKCAVFMEYQDAVDHVDAYKNTFKPCEHESFHDLVDSILGREIRDMTPKFLESNNGSFYFQKGE